MLENRIKYIEKKNYHAGYYKLIFVCKFHSAQYPLNKKVRDRSHAPKNATPIVAKQILNTKGHTLLSFKWNCVFTEFILNDKGKRV